ncbi:hypothetical protein JCGZ_03897 [Jatropha curcas]|uniref:Uncharacterized protein n=1 Tax=Jatropha curcas TaxID=180498 RepID=A0A067LR53_JATCU|nr:hypothetical protein JCGZ_03897 [Jatropha curcas]
MMALTIYPVSNNNNSIISIERFILEKLNLIKHIISNITRIDSDGLSDCGICCAYLFARSIFSDYISVGYSLLPKKEKAIIVQLGRVVTVNGPAFGCVLTDSLKALVQKLKLNNTGYENYHRIFVPDGHILKSDPKEPLRKKFIQKALDRVCNIVDEDPNGATDNDTKGIEDACADKKKGQYAKFWNEFGYSIKLNIIKDAKFIKFESTKSDVVVVF